MRAYRAPRIRTIGAIVVNPRKGSKGRGRKGRGRKAGRRAGRRASTSSRRKGARKGKSRMRVGGRAVEGKALRWSRVRAVEGKKGRKRLEITGRDLKNSDLKKYVRSRAKAAVMSVRRKQDARAKQWNDAVVQQKQALAAARKAKRSAGSKAGWVKRRAAKAGEAAAFANMGLGALRVNGKRRKGKGKRRAYGFKPRARKSFSRRGRSSKGRSRGYGSLRVNPDLTRITAPVANMVRRIPFLGSTLASSIVVAPIGLIGGLAVEIPIQLAGFIKDWDFVPAIFKESQPVFLATTSLLAAPLVAMVMPGSPETKRAAGIAVAAAGCGAAYYVWRTDAAAMQQMVTGEADAVSGLGAITVNGLGALGMGPAYSVGPDTMGALAVNPSYGGYGAVVVGGAT